MLLLHNLSIRPTPKNEPVFRKAYRKNQGVSGFNDFL